jgi:hypothetical protein
MMVFRIFRVALLFICQGSLLLPFLTATKRFYHYRQRLSTTFFNIFPPFLEAVEFYFNIAHFYCQWIRNKEHKKTTYD